MKFSMVSFLAVGGAFLPVLVSSFTSSHQNHLKTPLLNLRPSKASSDKAKPSFQWLPEEQFYYGSQQQQTRLHMAFKTDQPTNMWDGPMALTRERDACGVGFIANTKTGGTFPKYFWVYPLCRQKVSVIHFEKARVANVLN